jgi:hypothetical protein
MKISKNSVSESFVPGYLLKKGDCVKYLDDTFIVLSVSDDEFSRGVWLADKRTTKIQLKYNETDHKAFGPLTHLYLKYSK